MANRFARLSSTAIGRAGDSGLSLPSYRVGDKIEGNYRGAGKWYPGRVVDINPRGGAVDIKYDDGEEEKGVVPSLVRKVKVETAIVPGLRLSKPNNDSENEGDRKFRLHETVEVRRDNGVRWITAKISNVYTNGLMYDVRYDDGKEEMQVPSRMIRQIGKEQAGGRQLGLLRDDSLDAPRGDHHSDLP